MQKSWEKPHYRLICVIAPMNSKLAKMADHIQTLHSDESYRSESTSTIRKPLEHSVHNKKKMNVKAFPNKLNQSAPYFLCCSQLGEILSQLNLEIQSILFVCIIHPTREKIFYTPPGHIYFFLARIHANFLISVLFYFR